MICKEQIIPWKWEKISINDGFLSDNDRIW